MRKQGKQHKKALMLSARTICLGAFLHKFSMESEKTYAFFIYE